MQIPRKMSAQNVMASISRTLGTRHADAKAPNEVKFAGEESKDRLYEPKHKQKLVRVLTVVAYIICVSMAAIVLSLYYMYIWDPSDPHFKQLKLNLTAAAGLSSSGKLGQAPCNEVTPLVLAINEDISDDDEVPSVFVLGFSETMYERTGSSDSPLPATMSNKFNEGSERARLQHQGSKSLLKILTTLPSSHSQQDDIYYPKATDPPIIGGSEDYHDATMLPAAEDLLDD
ncbi:hypothetical protein TKK_0006032 [Trichogramma kaykai]